MNEYKVSKGTYREIVRQVTEITDVNPPTIGSYQEYAKTFAVNYQAKDNIFVEGFGGKLNIRVDQGNFGLWNRVKQAYDLVRGKNVKVIGGGPDKASIENNPVVLQYLADSKAFSEALALHQAIMLSTEVIRDRQFEITAEGIARTEKSLEDRLPK